MRIENEIILTLGRAFLRQRRIYLSKHSFAVVDRELLIALYDAFRFTYIRLHHHEPRVQLRLY